LALGRDVRLDRARRPRLAQRGKTLADAFALLLEKVETRLAPAHGAGLRVAGECVKAKLTREGVGGERRKQEHAGEGAGSLAGREGCGDADRQDGLQGIGHATKHAIELPFAAAREMRAEGVTAQDGDARQRERQATPYDDPEPVHDAPRLPCSLPERVQDRRKSFLDSPDC